MISETNRFGRRVKSELKAGTQSQCVWWGQKENQGVFEMGRNFVSSWEFDGKDRGWGGQKETLLCESISKVGQQDEKEEQW